MKKLFILLLSLLFAVTSVSANPIMIRKMSSPVALTTLQQLQQFSGLTFYKNYTNTATADADYSVGSPTATVTSARSATAPATYFDATGAIQTLTTANVPRFTQGFYDGTGWHSRPGILVENGGGSSGMGINQATYSYTFANAAWTKTNITVNDAESGLPLNATVSSLTSTNANSTIVRGYTDGSAAIYTASIFIMRKTGTGTINLRANVLDSYVDITSQVLVGQWTRVQASSTSRTNPAFDLQITTSGDAVYVYGAQLEKYPWMTSFVPNAVSSARTRPMEVITYAISGNRTAASETNFVKFTPIGAGIINDNKDRNFLATDTKQRRLYKVNGGTAPRQTANETDSASAVITGTSGPTAGTSSLYAGAEQHNPPTPYVTISRDGVREAAYSTADWTNPAWGTNFYLGCSNASSNHANAIIESVAIYSTFMDVPDSNHISYILSPSTTTYANYLYTPSTPSASNLVSGSAGTGNVLANSAYSVSDHYVCADAGWTKASQTCETMLLFQRNGADDQNPLLGSPIGDIIVRTYTKSTNTMGSSSTIWTDLTYGSAEINVLRNAGENFFRVYSKQYLRTNTASAVVTLMKSTDLTATSWGAPVTVLNSFTGPFGGWFNSATPGTQIFAIFTVTGNSSKLTFYSSADNGDTLTYYSDANLTGDYMEGEFVNDPAGGGKVLGIIRQNSGNHLLQITSSDYGRTWSAPTSTGLGSATGAKTTPNLKIAAGDLTRVIPSFYDRGDSRYKVGTPTKFSDAYAGNWLPVYLIGTGSQGNGGMQVIDYTLNRYIISTCTGAEPTNAMNWWVYKDIYTWVAQ